jgi:ATP-binding cassette subfamily B protein
MFKLIRYLKPYKADIIVGGLLKWLEALFELIVPLLMSRIVDVGIQQRDTAYILEMGGIMLALGVVGFIFAMISQTLATRSAQKVGQTLRGDMFAKVNSLSYADLDKFGSSTLVNRIINDSQQLSWAVALIVRLVVRAPFLILGAIVLSMIINVKISLIFIFASAAAGVIYYILMSKTSKYYKKTQKQLDKIALSTRENLSGTRVVRAFSREDEEISGFKTEADTYRDISVKAANLSALLNPLTYALFNTAIAAVLWFGGKQVYAGGLTQGEVIALVNYLIQISSALVIVANIVVGFTRASASAVRVNELLDTRPSVQKNKIQSVGAAVDKTKSDEAKTRAESNGVGGQTLKSSAEGKTDLTPEDGLINLPQSSDAALDSSAEQSLGIDFENSTELYKGTNGFAKDEQAASGTCAGEYALEFQDVTFTYNGNSKPSLQNISFKVKAGETVGIIGVTGSGKTTLINLIPRFYDTNEGIIRVFGKDIKEWDAAGLQDAIAVAEQKATLFSGTVRENMQWGKPDADEREIWEALQIACAKDFVAKKEDKLDARVERGGSNFSGGQRQRLNIARAVIKKPCILILDDSFSALDFQTDAKVRRGIRRNLPNTAKIVVSQRVSSVKNADLILVLDNGGLVGSGTHKQLYQTLPLYKSIVDMQTYGGEK